MKETGLKSILVVCRTVLLVATIAVTVTLVSGEVSLLQNGSSKHELNLRVMDWDLSDSISNAYISMNNGTDHVQFSDDSGWANYTGVNGTVSVKVRYYGFWVNGTLSFSVSNDTTINVRCKLYDVSVKTVEAHSAYLVNVNVTVFNSTSQEANKIATGVTGSNGYVTLENLPNYTLTFTQYAGLSYAVVIGNDTRLVSSESQTLEVTADQNELNTSGGYSIIAFVGMTLQYSLIAKSFKRCRPKDKLKRKRKKR